MHGQTLKDYLCWTALCCCLQWALSFSDVLVYKIALWMQPTAWQLLKSPAALCSQSRWMGNAVYSFEKSVKVGLKQSKIAQCHLGLCCAAFCVSKLKSALLSWGTIATSSSCTFQSSLKGGVWCSKLDFAVDQNKIFSSLLLLPPLCPKTAVPSLSEAFRAPKWTGQAAFFGFFLSLCWATCHHQI